MKLLQAFVYRFSCEHMFSFFFGEYWAVGSLGHMINLCLTLLKIAFGFFTLSCILVFLSWVALHRAFTNPYCPFTVVSWHWMSRSPSIALNPGLSSESPLPCKNVITEARDIQLIWGGKGLSCVFSKCFTCHTNCQSKLRVPIWSVSLKTADNG